MVWVVYSFLAFAVICHRRNSALVFTMLYWKSLLEVYCFGRLYSEILFIRARIAKFKFIIKEVLEILQVSLYH